MPLAAAVELLVRSIHALPHPKYGVINMLPFAHDSDEVRGLKHDVCEAVIELLDQNGYLNTATGEPVAPPPITEISIRCRDCDATLLSTTPAALVDPAAFIASIANLNPDCPHPPLTLDDMRIHMQREWGKALLDDEASL